MIVLFDNDTEGWFNFERCKQLNVPDNMDVLKLPDREEFRGFQTVGPSGIHRLDINGRAAAMEIAETAEKTAIAKPTRKRLTRSYLVVPGKSFGAPGLEPPTKSNRPSGSVMSRPLARSAPSFAR